MKNQWKKGLSVILCIALMLSCNAQVFALTIDYSDGKANIITDREQQELDARVKDVIQKIDEIGKVEFTDFCLSKIVKAENAFNRLTDELKDQVTNYSTLRYAREAYEALKAGNQSTSSFTVKDSGTIENVVWTFYTNGLLEISGEGALPSYKNNAAPWNNYLSSITSILVRNTISSIGASAFKGCNSLSEITLPFVGKSRSATGYESAFGYIFEYRTGNGGGSTNAAGYSVGDIYTSSSSGNSYVTYVNGRNIDYSYDYIYSVPSSIKTVNITDASRIVGGAFANCGYISRVSCNAEINTIENYLFYNCSSLKTFEIPSSVKTVGKYAFYNTNLTDVFLPVELKSINDYAFQNCSYISKLKMSDNVESIGSYAFAECRNIAEINIPDSVTELGRNAFAASNARYPMGATKLSIGSGLKTIPENAFSNCAYLTKVTVPNTVETIGALAFKGCNKLSEITLPFVGKSRSATGYESAFGYIFEYRTGNGGGSTNAAGYSVGDIYTSSSSGNSYVTYVNEGRIGYSCDYIYSVPSSIKTVNITDASKIGAGAFANCIYITKIVLNDSITSIGDYAFYSASGIKDFVIPNSVTSLGGYSFYKCNGLTEISIPNGITAIGKYTFYDCENIKKVVMSRNVISIGDYAFYSCLGITKLIIPDKVESIGSYAFAECRNIDEINIPDSVTELGRNAFAASNARYPMGATKLSIGSGLKTIPENAFSNCAYLTKVTVPNTVETIGALAFKGCNKLSEITLPFVGKSRSATGYESAFGYIFDYKTDGSGGGADATGYSVGDIYKCDEYSSRISYVTYVNEGRIGYSCDYIYSVPSSIKTVNITDASKIGAGAFAKCTYITKIVLNDGITSIGDFAFQNNPWYKSLTDEFVIDGDNVLIKYNGTKSNVVIPDTVKHIAGGVFKNNTKISAVTLPDELLSIGENTFNGCTNLTAMTIPKSVVKIGGNAIPDACTISVYRPSAGYDYRSTNRIVLNSSFTTGNETYYYIVNDDGCAEIIGCTTTSTELTVPTDFDGIVVNKIGDYGFANCTTLNSITIPANILNIGKYAFTGCTGLVNATIPTTVNTVGDYAFNNCTGLKNVTISEGVQALGEGAFYNCISLIEAVVPDTAKYVGSYAFYNCTSMVTATIGTTAESIGDYTFYNCEKLENIVVGYSVKTIGDYAFYNCALGRVSIPSATVSIGNYAFAENDKMTKATLRKNLLTIGNGAFRNCGALATITIPATVTSIGIEAFENCSSIPKVTIPVGVTEINDRAFSNCSSLANVTISGAVTRIGISAFYNNAFESIILPETVEVLGDSAFRQCANLKEITLPDALNTIGDAVFLKCSALYRVSLPDSVTSVGKSVFFYNNDITVEIRKNSGTVADGLLKQQGVHHVILDADITAIGNNVFDSCYELSTVTYGNETVNPGEYKLSSAIKTIGSEAFRDNAMLRNLIVPDTLEKIGEKAFYNVIQSMYNCKEVTVTFYFVNGTISENVLKSQNICYILVGDGISVVGTEAFNNCKSLKTVSLPDTVSTIGDNVFAASNGDIVLIFRGVDEVIDNSVCDGKLDGVAHLIVDKGVKKISDSAFSNNPLLVDLIISDAVTIGNYAFYNDIAINRVTIESPLYSIGNHAFDSCKSIPQVVLPETVREIGSHAFYDCNSMKSINVPVGVAAIKEYTFFGCASLLDISIPDTVLSVGDYAYYGCVVAKTLDLSNTLKSIGAYAFYNCNQVKEIILPNTLKSIGDYAFRSCSSITEISIPDSVTELGDCVFYACTGLEQAEFGFGITRIGNSEFYGCVKFKKLMLNGDVEYIHELAFYGAEDAVIYSFENQYVENYCEENGLEYHELANDFTMSLTPPTKTEYMELEELDLSGLALNITYTIGGERTITTGYTVSGYDPNVIGTQTVTVTYRGVSETFEVTVLPKEVSFITATPKAAINSIIGEDLDMSNVVITVNFTDGTSKVIESGYSLSGFDKETIGDQTVTLTYREKNCTFDVTVINYIPGDINGDGIVNMKDVTRLVNYLNDNEGYEVIKKALDVNGDGVVSIKDVTRLVEYLNDNTVEIH